MPGLCASPRHIPPPPPAAVAILVPNFLHESTSLAAIAAGKHVLIEKPIAIDVTSGRRIIAAAKEAGVVCMVAENAQYWHEVCVCVWEREEREET